jgi:hypothetical protein
MSKTILTSKDVDRIYKTAQKVKRLQKKIQEEQAMLKEIKNDNNWLNYLGDIAYVELTQEENWTLASACNVINYSDRDYELELEDCRIKEETK